MSPETLALLQELLRGVSVPASSPDFEELAAKVGKAKRELAQAIDAEVVDAARAADDPPASA